MGTAKTTPIVTTSTPKTILVATDFGACAEAALDRALALAPALGAKVYLLHAYVMPVAAFPGGEFAPRAEIAPKVIASVQTSLAEVIAKRKQSGVEIIPLAKEGDPRDTVLATAADLGADLVIVGTHGRRGIVRALLGSVAESIVRTSSVPVMTVHAPDASAAAKAEGRAGTPP